MPPAWLGIETFLEGGTTQFYQMSTDAPGNPKWRKHILSRGGLMEQGIKSGVIKGVAPEVLGSLDKVEAGLNTVHDGVSGKKIVIKPWAEVQGKYLKTPNSKKSRLLSCDEN
jgi:hypothetical protein